MRRIDARATTLPDSLAVDDRLSSARRVSSRSARDVRSALAPSGLAPASLGTILAAAPTAQAAATTNGHPSALSTPAADALPLLLTVEEVATLLRTTHRAVYAMAERAQLPGVTRIGRRLLVRRDDLLSWLDERRAASPGGFRR
jgi:excisionase family DNA binding protein